MAILLIDGDNLAHRSHHAAADLADADGNLTGCFFQTIISLHKLTRMDPHGMIVFWDGAKCKRRMKLWPLYKANRHAAKPGADTREMDEKFRQIRQQMTDLRAVALPALGVPQVFDRESEADDLIWAATKALKAKLTIVSTDSDFLQLVSDKVNIWHPNMKKPLRKDRQGNNKITVRGNERGVLINTDNFTQITGYADPTAFLDAKVMIGDTTDNIPGIPGLGDGKAKILFQEFENLGGILKNRKLIKEKGGVIWKRVVSREGLEIINRNYDMIALHMAEFNSKPVWDAIRAKTDPCLSTVTNMFMERGSRRLSTQAHQLFKQFKDMEIRWMSTRRRLLEGR